MVSTSGHRRLHAASIYTADPPCAFGAVRSYCSLHIVTILTENHIFSLDPRLHIGLDWIGLAPFCYHFGIPLEILGPI